MRRKLVNRRNETTARTCPRCFDRDGRGEEEGVPS
jgi:hypothetical protein